MENDNAKTETAERPVEIERGVSCRWWEPHKYTKWHDLQEATNTLGQPVLIQEKRCIKCNCAVRRIAVVNRGN